MTYHALLEYIHLARKNGVADDAISDRLQMAGWYAVDIEDALKLHGTLTASQQRAVRDSVRLATAIIPRTPSRTLTLPTALLAVVAFAAALFGYLWLVQ